MRKKVHDTFMAKKKAEDMRDELEQPTSFEEVYLLLAEEFHQHGNTNCKTDEEDTLRPKRKTKKWIEYTLAGGIDTYY